MKYLIRNKKTGKRTIKRDLMLIDFACKTGLRRAELASLKADDIKLKEQFVIVRKGKGEKDRTVPLDNIFTSRLKEYLEGMEPTASVFEFKERLITDLISTWENGYIESFNGKLRDELLNREIFITLKLAKVLIEQWRQEYNHIRRHSSLGYLPPAPEVIMSQALS